MKGQGAWGIIAEEEKNDGPDIDIIQELTKSNSDKIKKYPSLTIPT